MNSIQLLSGLLTAKERIGFIALTAILLVEALLEMVGVVVVPAFVTAIVYPEKITNYAAMLPRGANDYVVSLAHEQLVLIASAVVLTFYTCKAFYTVGATYWKARYAFNRARKLSVRLFSAYLRAPYLFHITRNTAELHRNVNQSCMQLAIRALLPAVRLLGNSVIILGIVAVLFALLEFRTIIWTFVFIGAGSGMGLVLRNWIRERGAELEHSRGESIKVLNEGFLGVKEIMITQCSGYFVGRFETALRSIFRLQRAVQTAQSATQPFIEVAGIIGIAGVTLMLISDGAPSDELVQTLSIFGVSFIRLKGAIRAAVDSYTEIRHSLPAVETIAGELAELETRTRPNAEPNEAPRLTFSDRITFENVAFSYPDTEEPTLENFNLSIKAGEAIAIVGASGSGKSTILNLLLGVLPPSGGKISVDGIDIHDHLDSWQREIGYVPQEMFLIDATIRENIALGTELKDINEESLMRAIRAANIETLIGRLPNGLDTNVGERGTKLSGGERQRISIARALYRDPKILILDEATSALDDATEQSIVDEVMAFKGERTIVMVAHRTSAIERCDREVMTQ